MDKGLLSRPDFIASSKRAHVGSLIIYMCGSSYFLSGFLLLGSFVYCTYKPITDYNQRDQLVL